MIRNYLITSFRNFSRHLGYSVINLSGLTIGLATSIFIFLWIIDEINYDTHHPGHERIYQAVVNTTYSSGSIETGFSSQGPLAQALKDEFAEVEVAARTDRGEKRLLRFGEKSLMQIGVWADNEIFDIFSVPFIHGDPRHALKNNNSIVITESVSKKFFGDANAIGKTFKVDEKFDMTVTGVVPDPHHRSRLKYDFLVPYEVHYQSISWMKDWGNTNDLTYIKLREGVSADVFNNKIANFIKSKCEYCHAAVWLQRFDQLRIYDRYENGKIAGGKIEYIRLFGLIGIFMLMIACINFMNLATARSATRSKEVGVRKVVGAQRQSLIFQFIGEALLLSIISMALALALVQLLLPVFNHITEKQTDLDFSNPVFTAILAGFTIFTGLIAGSYPAFYLSAFRPALVLKGGQQARMSGSTLRRSLVVFQFSLSIILIISSIVVYRQVGFIKNKNLGFDRENILTFDMQDSLSKNMEAFKTEALRSHEIKSITFAGQNPFSVTWRTTSVTWPSKAADAVINFKIIGTDKDFINTMGMELIAGSNFTDPVKDSANFIVNEAAVALLGYDEPIGAPLNLWDIPSGKIIGVVKNFHNTKLNNEIEPLIITHRPHNAWRGFVKIAGKNTDAAIQHLTSVQQKFDPYYPFEYRFLDEQFNEQYKMENIIENIAIYFTAVALFISCLGLVGLASFTAERRTKELGIRKVLGASVPSLVSLLCTDFAKLILIAIVIGCPLAYYAMDKFLSNYTYHTELHYSIFIFASISLLLIALLSVGLQSAKAAIQNPVKGLRNE